MTAPVGCRASGAWKLVACGVVALLGAGCEATERTFDSTDAGLRGTEALGTAGGESSGGGGAGGGNAGGDTSASGGTAGTPSDGRPNNGEGSPATGGSGGNEPNPIAPNGNAGFGQGGTGGDGTTSPGGTGPLTPVGGAAGAVSVEPYCGDGTADEGEECDPGDEPSADPGRCNADCELNACADGTMRACSEGGELGNCGLGMQLCDAGVWSACDVTPAAADSCEPGDDANCNGTPNENCGCVEGTTQKCAVSGAEGNCAEGDQECLADGTFGPCSVQPASADSCASPGDDANCDGTPNGGCACTTEGEEQPCGPATDTGVCEYGVTRCESGNWTACAGAVFPAARDCRSSADNDCNGSPDNTISGTCACTAGMVRACEQHPGQDGLGICEAGEQTCEVSANGSSSFWGLCTGSVGPRPADSCTVLGDDGNCDGTPNGGCDCVQGQTTTCAAEYGRQGDCGAYSLTCAADGRWPSETSACAARTGDSCAPAGQCLGGVWDSPSATFDDVCYQ